MTIPIKDQPIEKVREAAVDQLVMNYGHGKLSITAFDRRLEQAMDAKEHSQLESLTEDLELQVDQEYLQQKQANFGDGFDNDDYDDDVEYMFNIIGGSNRQGNWNVPKKIRMFNVMGGGELDFTDAQFTHRVTTVKIYSFMGGATIYVPENIRVKTNVFSFMGGFSDRSPSSLRADCPTLIIEGVMFMGGATIKVKKTFKQRMVEFGNSIKGFVTPDLDKVQPIRKQQ